MKQNTPQNNSFSDNITEKNVLTPEEKNSFVEDFADPFCRQTQEEVDKGVTTILNELYGVSLARGIKFLLDNVEEKVKRRFVFTYMAPETLACHVTSFIEVEATSKEERLTPNIGRFAISVCTVDGEKKRLRFANQVSTVYFLMYLINRKQKSGTLPVIDLARNKSTFVSLYHAVYDKITHTNAQLRHQQLLYSVVDGKIRAGRKAAIENDIRTQLKQAFASTNDSPIPYGMSSHRNLTISPDKIIFKDEARRLLYLQFT